MQELELTDADVYELPKSMPFSHNRAFDEKHGYRAKSMLVVPMIDHKDRVVGVLQLINRRRAGVTQRLTAATVPDNVIEFDEDTADIMRALASQAAVAVENNLLYESIERLFEGFVTAAVTAIEQRDPTTSGHSFRVADLTVELAKVIDHVDDGQYRDVRFTSDQIREIRYASLLHDFGKVGVPERVLVKAKKLDPDRLELIQHRIERFKAGLALKLAHGKIDDAELAAGALKMAVAVRGGDVSGVIFHSDRGSEYTADLFERLCTKLGITQSMSRVGSALDNAACESLFSTLEFELLKKKRFATKVEARHEVARYIDRYNRYRRHSSCQMKSPVEYEAILAAQAADGPSEAEAA